jgi:hypothetical protein
MALDIGMTGSHIPSMRSLRHSSVRLRLAFVAIFAFVSLIHGPAMAMAVAAGSPQAVHTMGVSNTHHHHHDHGAQGAPAEQPANEMPADGALCPMLGCSMALGPATPRAAVTWLAIGRIEARPFLALRAVVSEPADPPPRLPV